MFLTDNCDSCRAPEELVTNFHLRLRSAEGVGRGGEGDRGPREIATMCDIRCICICRAAVRYVKLPECRNCTFLVTLSARGHADKRRARSARSYDFFEPRSQLVSSYFNCEIHRVHVMKLRRAKNEIQTRKLSFFVVAR